MTKWEYFSVTNQTRLTDKTLSAFGCDGWELVSVIFDRPMGWIYHFKRPERLTLKGKS